MWKLTVLAVALALAACSKEVPVVTPASPAASVNLPYVQGPTTQLEKMGAVTVAPAPSVAATPAPVVSVVAKKKVKKGYPKAFLEDVALAKIAIDEFRGDCLRVAVERKVDAENFYKKGIMDWGNVRDANFCYKSEKATLATASQKELYKSWKDFKKAEAAQAKAAKKGKKKAK